MFKIRVMDTKSNDIYIAREISKEEEIDMLNELRKKMYDSGIKIQEQLFGGQFRKIKKDRDERYMHVGVYNWKMVGYVSMYADGYNRVFSIIEMGIDRECGGRGIMTQASYALVWYGCNVLGMEKFESSCVEGNDISMQIQEDWMIREGIKRGGVLTEEGRKDKILFGITGEEVNKRMKKFAGRFGVCVEELFY